MKKITIVFAALTLLACKKDLNTRVKPKPTTIAANTAIQITPKTVSINRLEGLYNGKPETLFVYRTVQNEVSTLNMMDKTSTISYLSFTKNETTGAVSNMKTDSKTTWTQCVQYSINLCVAHPLCSGVGGMCHGEWIFGCVYGWMYSCLWAKIHITKIQ